MATDLENIETGLGQVSNLVSLITASPTPTVTINGETIDMTGYLSGLTAALPVLLAARQSMAGPYQRVTRMRS